MAAHAKLIKDNEDTLIHVMCDGLRDGGFIEGRPCRHMAMRWTTRYSKSWGGSQERKQLEARTGVQGGLVRKRGSQKQERGGQKPGSTNKETETKRQSKWSELEACVKLEVETKKTEEQSHAVQADVEDHQAEGVQEHVGTIKERDK